MPLRPAAAPRCSPTLCDLLYPSENDLGGLRTAAADNDLSLFGRSDALSLKVIVFDRREIVGIDTVDAVLRADGKCRTDNLLMRAAGFSFKSQAHVIPRVAALTLHTRQVGLVEVAPSGNAVVLRYSLDLQLAEIPGAVRRILDPDVRQLAKNI